MKLRKWWLGVHIDKLMTIEMAHFNGFSLLRRLKGRMTGIVIKRNAKTTLIQVVTKEGGRGKTIKVKNKHAAIRIYAPGTVLIPIAEEPVRKINIFGTVTGRIKSDTPHFKEMPPAKPQPTQQKASKSILNIDFASVERRIAATLGVDGMNMFKRAPQEG